MEHSLILIICCYMGKSFKDCVFVFGYINKTMKQRKIIMNECYTNKHQSRTRQQQSRRDRRVRIECSEHTWKER